jgi:hypothetical protein
LIAYSLSLGGPVSQSVSSAIAALTRANIVVVGASGNDGTNACNKSPASSPDAIIVGASDSNDRGVAMSNYGSCVDVVAPGAYIVSTYIGGIYATAAMTYANSLNEYVGFLYPLFVVAPVWLLPMLPVLWLYIYLCIPQCLWQILRAVYIVVLVKTRFRTCLAERLIDYSIHFKNSFSLQMMQVAHSFIYFNTIAHWLF